jgi:hypothetical protein
LTVLERWALLAYIEQIKHMHIRHLPVADMNEGRNISSQVQQRMHLHGGLGRTEVSPIEDAQTEIDRGCLIPARTDASWWHDYVIPPAEIRFIRGRLRFGNSSNSAPFPSAVVVFRAAPPPTF